MVFIFIISQPARLVPRTRGAIWLSTRKEISQIQSITLLLYSCEVFNNSLKVFVSNGAFGRLIVFEIFISAEFVGRIDVYFREV